jgi:hypothetical protein
MQFVNEIGTAIQYGSAVVASGMANEAVKDAYKQLKGWIVHRYPSLGKTIGEVGDGAASTNQLAAVERALAKADDDKEVARLALAVLEAIRAAGERSVSPAVDIRRVEAASVRLSDIVLASQGAAVRLEDSKLGSVDISGVRVGPAKRKKDKPPPKNL